MSGQFGFGSAGSSPPPIDFRVSFYSSAAGFTPVTAAARGWVMKNVHTGPWQWVAGTLIVDHPFVQPLLSGILDAGMDMVA